MRYRVQIAGASHIVTVAQDAQQQWQVQLDDRPIPVDQANLGPDHMSLLIGDHSYDLWLRALPGDEPTAIETSYAVLLAGKPYRVDLVDERRHALAGMARRPDAGGDVTIKAPMPGLVINVLVAPGDLVTLGQRVVVLEAMKMQNDLTTPRAGIVRAVKTATGQAVNQGQPLVVIGAADTQ